MSNYTIRGHVATGYENVHRQFEQNFIDGIEENAQLCVYVGDERVVDLWGCMNTSTEYDGDSLTNVFSSSKTLAAICIATLVNKNLLNYSDTIVTHWPEYGNGSDDKEMVTIADILRHKGGMANFSETVRFVDIQRDNIKKNSIGSIIEKEPLCFPPEKEGTQTEYHDLTRGWILNEIFRRVDPAHRTIGECLQEDISIPLNADCYIGLSYEQLPRVASLSCMSIGEVVCKSFIPKRLGRKTEMGFLDLVGLMFKGKEYGNKKLALETVGNHTFISIIKQFELSVLKTGEVPSANGHCSARGLAKIASVMANKGSIDGIEILSEETWTEFHHGYEEKEIMYPFGLQSHFSHGGVNYFKTYENASTESVKFSNENRNGYFGWMGLGVICVPMVSRI